MLLLDFTLYTQYVLLNVMGHNLYCVAMVMSGSIVYTVNYIFLSQRDLQPVMTGENGQNEKLQWQYFM